MTLKEYYNKINKNNLVFAISETFPCGFVRTNFEPRIKEDKFIIFCPERGGPIFFDANQQVDILYEHSIMVVDEDMDKIKFTFLSASPIPHPEDI